MKWKEKLHDRMELSCCSLHTHSTQLLTHHYHHSHMTVTLNDSPTRNRQFHPIPIMNIQKHTNSIPQFPCPSCSRSARNTIPSINILESKLALLIPLPRVIKRPRLTELCCQFQDPQSRRGECNVQTAWLLESLAYCILFEFRVTSTGCCFVCMYMYIRIVTSTYPSYLTKIFLFPMYTQKLASLSTVFSLRYECVNPDTREERDLGTYPQS